MDNHRRSITSPTIRLMTALAIFFPSLLVFFKNFLEAKYIYAGASLIVAILSMASMATILVLTIV